MYYLDFVTIIQLLKEFRRSGMLQTELPAGTGNTQGTCSIQFKLLQGEINDCLLILDDGRTIAADEKVLRLIKGLGPLEWTFSSLKESHTAPMKALDKLIPSTSLSVPDVPLSSSKQPSSFITLLVPHRLAVLEQSSLNRLTRQQKRILALVDGRRNISQIVALLFSSSNTESRVQEVFTLLKDLEGLNFIVFKLQ